MADQQPGGKRRGCGRLFAFGMLLILALAATAGIALYTGAPQRFGLQYALSSQLNAEAQIASVSLRNPLIVQGLTLAGKGASLYGPPLQIDRTQVGYDWRKERGRYIQSVNMSGLRVSLQQGAADNNFQFLIDRFAQPGGGATDPTPYIPEQIGIDQLWIELNFPSYYLRMDNLAIHANLAGATAGDLAFGAPETGLAWSSVYTPGGQKSGQGKVNVEAAWDGATADLDVEVDLGPLARLRGTASTMQRDGQTCFSLSVPEAALEDPLWAAIITDLSPIPVRFDRLSLADSDVHLRRTGGGIVVDQATIDAELPALAIGPEDAPYYRGPLGVSLRGQYGESTTLTGTLRLLDHAALSGDFQFTPEGLNGTFAWEPWSRDVLAHLTPAGYAGVLDLLKPLNRLGARGTLTHRPEGLHVDATLAGTFGNEAPLETPVTLDYATVDGSSSLSIGAEVALHGGTLVTTVTAPSNGPVTVDNTLTGIEPDRWAASLLGAELLPLLSGAISGTARVGLPADQPLTVDLALSGAALRYGDLALPEEQPVLMNGLMTYDSRTGQLASRNLHLKQEGVLDATAAAWSLDRTKGAMRAALDGTLSLDAVAALFAIPDLYGDATIRGSIAVGPEATKLQDFTASSETLGFGDWSVPYGMALNLTGSLAYARGPNTLRLEPVEATIGGGSRCGIGALEFQFPGAETGFSVTAAPFAFQTDLEILAIRGLIAAATGAQATVQSDAIAWTGEGVTGAVTWDFHADHLELPEKMAVLEQIAWSGRFDPASGEPGGGRLTASAFSVYEIPFGGADTVLEVTPEHFACDALETTFLGGSLVLTGQIEYLDPTFPGALDIAVTALDLEEFTRTFEPPDVVLTGKVSGTADIKFSSEGLQDLHVDMTASDNLTLNRSMVRQILMSQYVNDAVGSKSVQKVIEKVIGKDDQRPFEKAILQLRLEDGLIKGEARLESKALDVTVDINAEPAAILEAIRSASE